MYVIRISIHIVENLLFADKKNGNTIEIWAKDMSK